MDRQTQEHVIVGAIVTFVFFPHSGGTLIGGALAGYLEGPDLRSGSRVGMMAGIVAYMALLVLSVGSTFLALGGNSLTDIVYNGLYYPGLDWILPLIVLPLIGGGIGAYVRRETDE